MRIVVAIRRGREEKRESNAAVIKNELFSFYKKIPSVF
jgi:hypothetical protein